MFLTNCKKIANPILSTYIFSAVGLGGVAIIKGREFARSFSGANFQGLTFVTLCAIFKTLSENVTSEKTLKNRMVRAFQTVFAVGVASLTVCGSCYILGKGINIKALSVLGLTFLGSHFYEDALCSKEKVLPPKKSGRRPPQSTNKQTEAIAAPAVSKERIDQINERVNIQLTKLVVNIKTQKENSDQEAFYKSEAYADMVDFIMAHLVGADESSICYITPGFYKNISGINPKYSVGYELGSNEETQKFTGFWSNFCYFLKNIHAITGTVSFSGDTYHIAVKESQAAKDLVDFIAQTEPGQFKIKYDN